jgi:5-methylcytosine-specific restriction endonuclease McrA
MALLRAGRLAIRDRVCECGAEFQGTAGRRFCDTCRSIRRGDHYRAKGARRREVASATGERITIAALGDRDAWTCWICSQFVNRDLSGRDPRMPSFDHVLPISRGGLDSWDNLRLAHLVCNVKRGNRDMVQSLVQTQ